MKIALGFAIALSVASSQIAMAQSLSNTLHKRLDIVTSTFQKVGGACPIGKPKLIMDSVPTFGGYDEDRNELHITPWHRLSSERQSQYAHLVGAADVRDAEKIFESANYRWVFVHELGHWWQYCSKRAKADPYAIEFGADRIASAFWRKENPTLMATFAKGFSGLTHTLPSVTPPGVDARKYFDDNYATLGRNPPAYIWFQAKMVVDAYNERPSPSLRQALQNPTYVPRL